MHFALPSPMRSRFSLFCKRSSFQRNDPPSSILPVTSPAVSKAVKGEFPTEIYELIIDHLGPDKPSLYACMLVCRSWYPRSSYLFSGSMICRPVRRVGLPDSKKVTCAVPYKGNGGGILYGTADGIHRATEDGSDSRLFAIQDVSQIDILEGINLFLCLAGGELMSMPLDKLMSGIGTHTNRIPSWRASFFAQNTSTVAEGHRVCLVKSSSTSVTIKVLAVHINGEGIHTGPLLHSQDLWIPTTREACSVQFIAPLKLVVIHGGFDIIDLETLDSHRMPEPSERLLKFIRRRDKPIAVFRSLDALLLCYHKFAFHADARGIMAPHGTIMGWTVPAMAFAQHGPYILVFGSDRVEVWHVGKAERVQIILGRYLPLNSRHLSVCRHAEPIHHPRIIALSDTVVDLVVRQPDIDTYHCQY